jgi:hypothetical protein
MVNKGDKEMIENVEKLANINELLEGIESLEICDQMHVLDVLSKMLVELRGVEIAKRAEEAEQAYREDKVKKGTVDDLWLDLKDKVKY